MGQVTTRSPLTGRLYTFNVAGDQPTEQERLAVAQYLIASEGQTQQPQTSELIEQEERESNALIDVPREFTRSLTKGFADIPGGLASLATAISPLDKFGLGFVEDYVESAGQGVTKAAKEGIDNLLGEPVDTPAGKLAGAVGSIVSYFVPVGAAAKVASGLGKGAKAVTALGAGTSAAMGVAQNSQEQVERIARQIELGQEVDNKDLAIILGGVIGAGEFFPLQKAFKTFTRALKGVPKDAKKDAIEAWLSKVDLKARAKSAGKTGLFEAAQEATAGWAQDLVEKNLYNPELEISLSSYQDDAIYGGGAGAAFNFFIDTIAGRKLKKSLNSRNQLQQDMDEEGQANRSLLDNAETSLGTAVTFDAEGNAFPKGGRPLIGKDVASEIISNNPDILKMSDAQFAQYNPFNPQGSLDYKDLGIPNEDTFLDVEKVRKQKRQDDPSLSPVDALEGQIPSPAQDAEPTAEQIAASANVKQLALEPNKEAELQSRRAKEILLANPTEIEVKDLPEDEQAAVRQYRIKSGLQDIEAPLTRDELEEAVSSTLGEDRGIEAANREGAKRFPETFEPKLTEQKAAERKAEAVVQARVAEVIEDAKAGLKNGELLKKNGTISLGKVKSKLKLNQNEAVAVVDKLKATGYATPISPTELKPVLPEARLEPANFTKVRMLQDGVANDKDYLAGAEVSVTDTEALLLQQTGVAEPISEGPSPEQETLREFQVAMQELQFDRAEQQRRLDKMKEAGAQDQTQQIMLENQQRVVDDANARLQAALNKEQELLAKANLSNPQNSDGLPADQVLANEARQAAEESTASQPTEEYKRKINTVANLLRKYMFKELGIRDVDIVTENVLEPDKIKDGFIVEGSYDGSGEGRKIIALAMEIYDPNLTEAQLFQRLRGVLNHEVIHALRGLGVLTEQEFATLVKAASKRKFVKKVGGRLVERDYTFLDRAVAMNENKSIEYQQEEAVAEMFRSYADGKIKVAGKPRTIFQKIGRFFKSIFNAHRDAGFTDAASIFDNIQSGKVGRRQRSLQTAAAVPAGTKYSVARTQGLNTIREFIKNNPDGFTITSQGISVPIGTPNSGIVVAPIKDAELIVGSDIPINVLREYIENAKAMSGIFNREVFLGGWLNNDNGKYYLDNTLIVNDKAEALYFAQAAKQIAVYDLRVPPYGQEIVTDEGIKQLQEAGIYRSDTAEQYRRSIERASGLFRAARIENQRQREAEANLAARAYSVAITPKADPNGNVRLTHYSPVENLEIVNPEEQGSNNRMRGQERSRQASAWRQDYPARSYYGLNVGEEGGYSKEYAVGDNIYVADVPLADLYNFEEDPEGFKSKADGMITDRVMELSWGDPQGFILTQAEKMVADAGYSGYYTNTPMGLVAAMFNPIKVKPNIADAKKFSVARLSPAEIALTSINNVNTELGDPENNYYVQQAPYGSLLMQTAVLKMQQDRGNVVLNWDNPDNWETLARLMAAEAEVALSRDKTALGWYDRTLDTAKRITSILFPDIKPNTNAESAFIFATAVTSNGVPVIGNWQAAAEQYRNWKDTGRFIEKGYGEQGSSMIPAFQFYNAMKDLKYTDLEIKDFLNQKTTVRELRQNNLLKGLGYKDSGAESADTEVFVSYILGPKIGQGFYQNLVGNFNTLTMDRWWMRMFNRISGQPFVDPERPETFDKRVSEIIEFSNNPVSDAESTIINVAKAEINADIITPENVDEFSYAVNRYFQRVYKRLSKSIKTAKESLAIAEQSGDPTAIQKARDDLLNAERNRNRDPNKIFLPFKSRLFQRIGGHVGKLENARKGGEMQEDPRVPKQRQVMRAIANRAREIVQEDLGISMSNADFQALMWYPEKNLFYSYGVKKSQGDDNDYIDGAIALLEKEGYNVDTIAQALPESDARIVNDRKGAAESYERTGIELTEPDRPEEGAVSDAGRRKRSVARVAPDRNYSMPTQVLSDRIDQQAKNHTYDNASRILAKVIRGATFGNVSKQKAQGLSERFLTKYQDSMLPLGKMLDEIRANPDNDMVDAFDAYMQEELSQGVAGARIANNTQDFFEPIAEAMKNIDVSEVQLNSIGSKYIRDYLATEADPRQVIADAYLYARHAKERNKYILDRYKRGNGSGMSDAEADTILSWVNGQSLDLKASLDEVASIADQIIESTNAFRKEGDLIPDFAQVAADPESKWQPTNFSFYVPLRGTLTPEEESVDDFGNVPRRTPNLYGARGRNDARMQGRGTEYATDIVSHLMAQNMLTIQRAEKNKVGKAFYDMVASDQVDTADYAEIVDKVADPNNTLTVKINGEDKHVEIFDDRIARAMNGAMTPQSQSGLVKFMAGLNRLLSNMNTSWNPEFVLSNFPRDLEAAGVNLGQYDEKGLTKDVIAGAFPAVKGIGDFLRTGNISSEWSGWYKEFVDNGGKNATNQMSDLQDSMNSIKSVLNDISNDGLSKKFGAMKNKFTQSGIIKFLDDWNTAVENGVRVSLYKQLVERGYSPKRAAQAARNITVNFAKGGEDRALMNAWFLFYNASLQGTMALANAAVRSPKVRKLWIGLLMYGFMQDMILGSMSGDEDEDGKSDYDEIGDYELEHNFILPTFGLADEKYIAIPLSYGLNMAVNTGRSVSRLARGEYTPSQAAGSITGTVLETLNPLGSGIDDYENILAPTVVDPFLSVAINKDYKGAPIYKEGSPFGLAKPDSQLYWNNTGPIPKFIADQVNKLTGGSRVTPGYVDMSPDVLEFWFNYLTGATGAFVKRSIEAPVNIYDAIQGDFEGTLVETIPFVRKVVATPTEIQDMGTYIENKDKVLRARKELETAIAYGEVEQANEIRKEYAKLLRIYGLIKGFENARNRLIRKKSEIQNSPRIPDERKSQLIQKINERIKEIVTRSNRVMYDVGIR